MQQLDVFNQGLIQFLQAAPTPAHAVQVMQQQLTAAGFHELKEQEEWALEPGQGYWVVRGGKSLVAWRQGQQSAEVAGVRMLGAHTDSPCLKVKPKAEIMRHGCLQLGVEVYGGALLHPWFDRDLSLAGQVHYLDTQGQLKEALYDAGQPLAVIPSLAIHLNREANKGMEANPQKHLPVILGQLDPAQPVFTFRDWLAEALRKEALPVKEVVDYDLSFYDVQPPAYIGLNQEYLASARLDNLLSCYVGLQALLASNPDQDASCLLVCNDHEEVGSASALGAEGPFLESVLRRLTATGESAYQRMISRSLMISCDNAHALHPNFADRHDENHGPKINAGPVIKINANQRYATSSETSALFAGFCRQAQVPCQRFVVRSDMGCGSTIGPISSTRLGVRVVDVGAPQWAMHSVRETVGSQDPWYLARALVAFFASDSV